MSTITDPASPAVQAIFLKGHLKLHKAGLKHSHLSKKKLLELSGNITGKTYKNKDTDQAIADLQLIVNEAIK